MIQNTKSQPPIYADAALILEDGSIFWGKGFGTANNKVGELCFHTAMTGYQEILTDPSFKDQIITFAFPHIGNVGVNALDMESRISHINGAIFRSLPTLPSNFRSENSLEDFFKEKKIPGIFGINTRLLVQHIRDHGAQSAVIVHNIHDSFNLEEILEQIKVWPTLLDADLAIDVMCQAPYEWKKGSYDTEDTTKKLPYHVIVMDYGVKENILRSLVDHGCLVTVVPGNTPAADVIAKKPDGILLSNGPGDPFATGKYACSIIKDLINSNIPIFGICLGHQMLALALEGQTLKMELGHRGANHPVQNIDNKRVEITSQNHGFAVDKNTLPDCLEATHFSLFDGSLAAMRMKNKNVFSVQFHPEASPGPFDSQYHFKHFIKSMTLNK